ncbi:MULTISPECIES: ATP-binding protein [Streptomyces]|uniref:ATP-binding protein n=1 Tax=Streptomyces TaxID=1883 RepID=UPI00203561D8|nr:MULTISPECIES: ATP-binding protein [Streptomyces]UUA04044.1 ATP-binding protein [Streptomyces koelreuteriae]UUA11670.1 ATP-binding protein [Streptomyces sp. CRCS-T-1]
MSSPAQHVLRPPSGAGAHTSAACTSRGLPPGPHTLTPYGIAPTPETRQLPSGALAASATLRVECGLEGFARARSFTRDTLHLWSLDHCREDATLVVTKLTANAATHAAPGTSGAPEVRLGFRLNPTHLLVTVSDPDDHPPVHRPAAGSALEEHGRGLRIVDALSEEWGWTPHPPAGKTVWARLSTSPPI